MLKILKVKLQQFVNHELSDVQTRFRKGRGTRDQIANIHWIIEKAWEFQRKKFTFASLTTLNLCGLQQTGKFLKRWEYQTIWPAAWETGMQVKKQQLELDMEQRTGSKSQKEYIKAVYCHPADLTYMQSTSWKMLDCVWRTSWNQGFQEKYQ